MRRLQGQGGSLAAPSEAERGRGPWGTNQGRLAILLVQTPGCFRKFSLESPMGELLHGAVRVQQVGAPVSGLGWRPLWAVSFQAVLMVLSFAPEASSSLSHLRGPTSCPGSECTAPGCPLPTLPPRTRCAHTAAMALVSTPGPSHPVGFKCSGPLGARGSVPGGRHQASGTLAWPVMAHGIWRGSQESLWSWG